ncbi:sigma-70 family RNA polymerase sigma factor [Flavobacteriaceae bacterium TP-CH-4]|uniref:RNA polymerase sigma factor n=1 Tax=Pelagihabitans pacificus TaxID=2696054 RepID=A0A967E6P6_9FLAO|nr:sigma-70 family RNA polymerase sigma factor [Pelagihabitans pacificus]NHF59389.1 sigma-70 family RNA polymerase sigma factor [Pelagihabitans pacificus]
MKNNPKTRDYDLIRRINAGDIAAFKELVQAHKDVSLSLAYSILRNQMLAEDVLQNVFIKVYQKLHTFEYNATFTTWLYRIVVNTSYNELKRQKTNSVSVEQVLEIESTDSNTLSENDQKKYIHLALEKLRPDESLIMRLFYLGELKIREIEEITGFNASKIKVDLHRGRENLHFHLQQLLGDDLNYLL